MLELRSAHSVLSEDLSRYFVLGSTSRRRIESNMKKNEDHDQHDRQVKARIIIMKSMQVPYLGMAGT